MSAEFCHLHLHTDYSMLDGACQVDSVAERCQELGMKAVALTDHGNMCGAVEFYQAVKKAGVKPVLGCEFYLAPDTRKSRSPNHPEHKGYHQILYAANLDGYRNLCRLGAIAYLEGYYFKPRIDKEVLARHAQGLIGTTACLGGEVPTLILKNDLAAARQALGEYRDILGKENFYLELQDHGMPEQRRLNATLVQFSKEFDLPLLATNDVHYLLKEHALPHEVLLCIGTQTNMSDEKRMRFPSENFYLKTAEEMAALFAETPTALSNTLAVAERCNVALPLQKENHYPVYQTPDGSDRAAYLLRECRAGLKFRYGIDLDRTPAEQLTGQPRQIVDRMYYEAGVIERMGFTSYFLVVWDFLSFARREGIPIGPGRGSGAGSIVAYLLRITDIEPLRYNLLFERFLNPDRVSPPDFDIDLCERRRGEVIEYVRRRYGKENVAQIGTFGTLKAKQVTKDVARALGRSFDEGNRLAKLIPADPKMTLDKAVEGSPELQEFLKRETWAREIFDRAKPLEGLSRNLSIHAAGVIIGDQPLTNLVPLALGADEEVITQYPAAPCEQLGLLKMDFLGLRTLTILRDAGELLKKSRGLTVDEDALPLDDAAAYKLLQRGRTVCVFQLESKGMQDLCRRWAPTRIEDIIALIALYRPGPMQFLEDFLDRKAGRVAVEYDVPTMKPILEETYGIMLYQEQVMQVVQTVAGFSLGQADVLRRAMGKKKPEEMAKLFSRFIEGCAKNGIPEATAKSVWAKVDMFSGYGFNKSHSAAYAFVAYRTAYFKANYPVEFMAANLTNEMRNRDRVVELIAECREMDIPVLPPDVNISELNFTVDGPAIRFGLAAIKGIGGAAAEIILKARQGGPFKDLQAFCVRTEAHLNRKALECLCQAGAFDCFKLRRAQLNGMLENVAGRAQAVARDRQRGQESFFDMLEGGEGGKAAGVAIPDVPEWPSRELLKLEKEHLGFYVTGHPLNEYRETIEAYSVGKVGDLAAMPEDQGVRLGGLIAAVEPKVSKRDQRPWAILRFEDREKAIEALVYSDTYSQYGQVLAADKVVLLEGFVVRRDEEKTQLLVSRVVPIEEAEVSFSREVLVRLDAAVATPERLAELRAIFERHPGETAVILSLFFSDGRAAFIETGKSLRVRFDETLKQELRRLLGENAARAKPERRAPKRERRRWESHSADVFIPQN